MEEVVNEVFDDAYRNNLGIISSNIDSALNTMYQLRSQVTGAAR